MKLTVQSLGSNHGDLISFSSFFWPQFFPASLSASVPALGVGHLCGGRAAGSVPSQGQRQRYHAGAWRRVRYSERCSPFAPEPRLFIACTVFRRSSSSLRLCFSLSGSAITEKERSPGACSPLLQVSGVLCIADLQCRFGPLAQRRAPQVLVRNSPRQAVQLVPFSTC